MNTKIVSIIVCTLFFAGMLFPQTPVHRNQDRQPTSISQQDTVKKATAQQVDKALIQQPAKENATNGKSDSGRLTKSIPAANTPSAKPAQATANPQSAKPAQATANTPAATNRPTANKAGGPNPEKDEQPVDQKSRRMFSVPVGDSMGVALVGDVILYHNGAVITCDSVMRYSDKKMSCFGKVVINKDETYIYGDRADYDGYVNEARVYSPLIKVVDKDATLYTYNFKFNTLDNIGEYYGSGTMVQGENRMESERGYYYSDLHEMVGVGDVEMRDSSYMLITDSIRYNTDTQKATFYTPTNIWNDKGEYLRADEGDYLRNEERYLFRKNAYIMTQTREIWADSIDYQSAKEDVEMRHNVQIRDEENKGVVFGHYAHYLEDGDAILANRPAMMSWNSEEGDTLYMRGDTIMLFLVDSLGHYKLNRPEPKQADTLQDNQLTDSLATTNPIDSLAGGGVVDSLGRVGVPDSLAMINPLDSLAATAAFDSLGMDNGPRRLGRDPQADSLAMANNLPDSLKGTSAQLGELSQMTVDGTEGELRGRQAADSLGNKEANGMADKTIDDQGKPDSGDKEQTEQKSLTKAEQRAAEAAQRKAKKEAERKAKQEEKERKQAAKEAEKAKKKQAELPDSLSADSLSKALTDSLATDKIDSLALDSLSTAQTDSLALNSLPTAKTDSLSTDSLSVTATDSLSTVKKDPDRVLQAYRNVKIYRTDFQAICDSLMAFTVDSTAQLHIRPVMWNELNQITGDRADIETKNQQIKKITYTGMPIMSSEVDTMRYNQVEGKTIVSLFEEGVMNRVDVDGNARTLYYITDDKDGSVQGFLSITSANITFFIADNTVERMTWRQNPEYSILPMDQIPATVAQRLENFKWYIDEKPTIEMILTPHVLRQSERIETTTKDQPQFPITNSIDKYRVSLLESGRWADREDKLTTETIDFISSREGAQGLDKKN